MEEMNTKMLSQLRSTPRAMADLMQRFGSGDIQEIIPAERLKKIRTAILTGCGEAYFTAAAAKPAYENKKNFKGTGMYPGIETYEMPAITFSRYYCSYLGWNAQRKANHLVVCVDKSGASSRVTECMLRAKSIGSPAVLITSPAGRQESTAAEYIIVPPLMEAENDFCWHSAALYSALLLGMQMGMAKGLVSAEEAKAFHGSLLQYVRAVEMVIEPIEKQCCEIAEKWQNHGIEAVQFASAGQDFATAGWGSDMMIRALGIPASLDDLEGWCHVDVFTAPNNRIGCVVVINSNSPSYSRAVEVAQCMLSLGRQVVVVSDKADAFPGADLITMPHLNASWGEPVMQHLPLGFIMAHMARMRGLELAEMTPEEKALFHIQDSSIEIY